MATTPPWPASSSSEPGAGGGVNTRLRLTVAYDGRGYHGFAAQEGLETVGGRLSVALERVLGQPVRLTCAGRTDRGVHAWGQVVTFDVEGRPDCDGLLRALNRMLAPSIVVREASPAPPGFDARRSAAGRSYRYTVLNRPLPDPFLAPTTWHVPEPLSLPALRLACDPLIGQHDFSSFCRTPRKAPEASMVRRVREARWTEVEEGLLRFEIEASAFCHQMVRSLVGTMVAMGAGRRRPGDMAAIIRGRDRHLAEQLAPPHGLCLWAVTYPDAGLLAEGDC